MRIYAIEWLSGFTERILVSVLKLFIRGNLVMHLRGFGVAKMLANFQYWSIKSWARAYSTCSMCEWVFFFYFYSLLYYFFSFYLPLFGRRPDIDWNTMSRRAVKPTTTNQPTNDGSCGSDNVIKYAP